MTLLLCWYTRLCLQDEQAAIEALLAEEVDTSDIVAAAAALPDLADQLNSAAADEAARGGPLTQEAVQEYINALRAVDVTAGRVDRELDLSAAAVCKYPA